MIDERPWVEFDAPIEAMAWGRNVYTIVRLDPALALAAAAYGTRRVEGWLDEIDVNVGVNRAEVLPDAFMYAGKGLLRRVDARPGDVVRCRLRPVDQHLVPVPDDVAAALLDSGRLPAFERNAPAARRRLLVPIYDAAKADTRRRRIAELVASLPTD